MENPLVIARAGSLEYLERFYDLSKDFGELGNTHMMKNIDYRQPQGRLLWVDFDHDGILGTWPLESGGNFLGIPPGYLE
jgi:hypothetical protein